MALIASSLVLRWIAGIGTLPELLGDRIAPMLGLHIFFSLIGFFRSYALLKQFGIVSMLANELLAGVVFGLLYSWLQHKDTPKARGRFVAAVTVAFVAVTAFLWGNLITNYLGLPPRTARTVSVFGLALTAMAFTAAILWANRLLTRPTREYAPEAADHSRRTVLLGGAGTALTLFSLGALWHFFRVGTYSYDGTVNAGPNLPPVTPNDKFYSVTKNNVDPTPKVGAWGLEVKGNVRTPLKLRLADLEKMQSFDQQTTLQCISNPVGGNLSSNAIWTGVSLRTLLDQAGASDKAKQIMFFGADGFVDTIPIEAANHPYTLVVHKMNGADLPEHHGFPVRLIVPGYVGEKSVKWLTGIEVREEPGDGFYEKQGWGPHFEIENSSRFDAPAADAEFKVNQPAQLKGTAFGGDRGVRAVQITLDGGDTWKTAEITYPGTRLTWAQWVYNFVPKEADDFTATVRCIDGLGGIQSDVKHGPGPGQVSGQPDLDFTVKA